MNTENNKIIAEFMGKRIRNSYLEKYIETSENVRFPNGDLIFGWQIEAHESKIKYHSDWNWLMKVVEKIENSIVNGTLNGVIVTMGKNLNHKQYCYIEWGNTNNVRNGQRNLSGFYSKTIEAEKLIEAVYNACVEFIKWCNQQEK